MMDIGAALTDPRVFQPWFSGSSWDGWRAVLRAAFAERMTKAEKAFFQTVANRDPPEQAVKELWVIAGRRSGKDSIASVIAAHVAAGFEPAGRLRPGERALCAALAVDRTQAATVLGYTRAFFEQIPALAALVRRTTPAGFELTNGVDIEIVTNDFRSVRGRTVLACVLDEVAYWRDETSASPDREVYRALRPGMLTLPQSIMIGITTAYRRSGLAYDRWQKHFGHDSAKVLVIHAESRTLNPLLPQAEIDEAMLEDVAAAKADYLSQWRDDLATFVSRELIEAAVDRGVTVRPPLPDVRYHSFCDPSGGQSDSFTCAVAHAEGSTAVLDCLVEIKPPFNPDVATAHICDVLKSYSLLSTSGDKYAAQWVISAFQKNGISYQHSERDRSALYLDALPLFSAGRVRLLDSTRLVSQFTSLERVALPIGKDKIQHPRGGHDDLANSAAGALAKVLKADLSRWWAFAGLDRAADAQQPCAVWGRAALAARLGVRL